MWGLLFFNVMTYTLEALESDSPSTSGRQGPFELALGVALLLIVTANKKLLVRPNIFLILLTTMCLLSGHYEHPATSVFSSMIRWSRFVVFIGTLWLTTPWWGRRDFMILNFNVVPSSCYRDRHCRVGILADQGIRERHRWTLGRDYLADSADPGGALPAMLVGMTVVLLLAGVSKSRWTGFLIVGAFGVLILTHSRTALIAMLAGILAGGLSLFLSRKRVRRAFVVSIVVVGIGALSFSPFITRWFARGENAQGLTNLTGRTIAWSAVLAQPRTEVNVLLGYGVSNEELSGVPIDSSWLSTYQIKVSWVMSFRDWCWFPFSSWRSSARRGPGRAVALFVVVYLAVESFAQDGLGQPSSDLLDLAVAMSLLMPPLLLASRSETSKISERSV